MAHQTGTNSSIADLFNKLANFALSLGWVIDRNTGGSSPELCLHHVDVGYFSMSITGTTILLFGNTSFDSSKLANAQPGSSKVNQGVATAANMRGTGVSNMADPSVGYDFLGTAQYIHAVVQIKAGQFRHFGFGLLNKEGVYTGGQYIYGTVISSTTSSSVALTTQNSWPFSGNTSSSQASLNYTSFVRMDKSDGSPWWFGFGYLLQFTPVSGATAIGPSNGFLMSTTDVSHPDEIKVRLSQSQFGQFLTPVETSIIVRTEDGIYRRIGTVPDFQCCRMLGISPKTVFDIVGERWMIIPPTQYQSSTAAAPTGENNSYIAGFALKVLA